MSSLWLPLVGFLPKQTRTHTHTIAELLGTNHATNATLAALRLFPQKVKTFSIPGIQTFASFEYCRQTSKHFQMSDFQCLPIAAQVPPTPSGMSFDGSAPCLGAEYAVNGSHKGTAKIGIWDPQMNLMFVFPLKPT